MQSTSGVDLLVQALSHHSSGTYSYTIHWLECYYKETEVAQHLLAGLPHHSLSFIEGLLLLSEALPTCLPGRANPQNEQIW